MIKVEFKWDPGDRESGIQPGWGEETVVLVEMHGFTLIIGFVPIESRDFSDWRIDQIDVTITGSPGTNIGAIDHPTFWPGVKSGKKRDGLFIGDLPEEIRDAVRAEWRRLQELEEEAEAELDLGADLEALDEAAKRVPPGIDPLKEFYRKDKP
jgi:hypothetical protein